MIDNDSVICQICGRAFDLIHPKHLKLHGLTFDQYKTQFPDAPTCSKASLERRKNSMVGREISWADKIATGVKRSWSENKFQGRTGIPLCEESRKKLSQKLMGHSVSDETRIKIGITGLGRTPWNKGITKEDDDRLKTVSEKIRIWNKEHMTPEIRHQISQSLKQKYADGMQIPQSKGNKRADLGMYFRSTWEANYARILNYENTEWEYETGRFSLLDDAGEIAAVYTPDFLVNGKWIEIKGHADASDDWECDCKRCERDKLKMLLFAEQYPDEEIEIIGKREYRKISKKYASIIESWEKSAYD